MTMLVFLIWFLQIVGTTWVLILLMACILLGTHVYYPVEHVNATKNVKFTNHRLTLEVGVSVILFGNLSELFVQWCTTDRKRIGWSSYQRCCYNCFVCGSYCMYPRDWIKGEEGECTFRVGASSVSCMCVLSNDILIRARGRPFLLLVHILRVLFD